jgi:hypothetical protein
MTSLGEVAGDEGVGDRCGVRPVDLLREHDWVQRLALLLVPRLVLARILPPVEDELLRATVVRFAVERVAGAVGGRDVDPAVRRLRERSVGGLGMLEEGRLVDEVDRRAVAATDVRSGLADDEGAGNRVLNLHVRRVLFRIPPLGLHFGRQQVDELAHLPEQRGWVVQHVHVILFARPEADDGAVLEYHHPGRERDGEPRDARVPALLDQAVLALQPALKEPPDELPLPREEQEWHDRSHAALGQAGVECHAEIVDEIGGA